MTENSPSSVLLQTDALVIADKAHGIPTVPLKSQGPEGTLLGYVSSVCPDVLSVRGRNAWEYGAVHRLDTATGGLVVFARTQEMYDHLQAVQAEGLFRKTYLAVTSRGDRLKGMEPDLGKSSFTISSYFRSYGPGAKEVRPVTDASRADSSVLYSTEIEPVSENNGLCTFRCTITRGFRHQIRAHLAWMGYPIVGDDLYGDSASGSSDSLMRLDCVAVSFPMPDGSGFSFCK